jgi:hypothetical protein
MGASGFDRLVVLGRSVRLEAFMAVALGGSSSQLT